MKIHHLNLCTMCPFGGSLLSGEPGSVLTPAELVVHALLVETGEGLVLVDAGMSVADVRAPLSRLGPRFLLTTRPRLREADTAVRQVERLGFRREDVRHVVLTHLDVDHAGGVADFPDAEVHVHRREHEAATSPATASERARYRHVHGARMSRRWRLHEAGGDRWRGFESVRAVSDDVLLIPLFGHSRGHSAVAVRAPVGGGVEWLLHAGDAYFFHGQVEEPPSCPWGLEVLQRLTAIDDEARRANIERLRALRREHGARVSVFSAHSARELRSYSADA